MTSLPRRPRPSRRSRALLVTGVLLLAVVGAACEPDPPPPPPDVAICGAPADSTATAVKVMGPCSQLTVDEIVAWFDSVPGKPTYKASAPIRDIVTYYLEEGAAEGVRGDLAFAQAIIETGYFSSVIAETKNNYAGIGAVDSDPQGGAATFPDARTGVRAQIQHLRAYADKTATACTVPPLHYACVDPRFHLVSPKGKAPTWNQFGNGVWATDPTYSYKIVGQAGDTYKGVYTRMLEKYGLPLA